MLRAGRMHHVVRGCDITLVPACLGPSRSFARCSLIDGAEGSVHMGLGLCELGPLGHVDVHIHSFEESFYVLDGSPAVVIDRCAYPLAPGACGLIPVGTPHAWLEPIGQTAKWIDMAAPQPRLNGAPADTFFLGPPKAYDRYEFDLRDPRSHHVFQVAASDIELDRLKAGSAIDAPTFSATQSTRL